MALEWSKEWSTAELSQIVGLLLHVKVFTANLLSLCTGFSFILAVASTIVASNVKFIIGKQNNMEAIKTYLHRVCY